MRGRGLLLILTIIAAIAAYSQFAAAGAKSVETTVVPNAPVAVSCRVTDGHTIVSISAMDDVHSISMDLNGSATTVADNLPRGWSISRSVSGINRWL